MQIQNSIISFYFFFLNETDFHNESPNPCLKSPVLFPMAHGGLKHIPIYCISFPSEKYWLYSV